jgi:hypothetical protein
MKNIIFRIIDVTWNFWIIEIMTVTVACRFSLHCIRNYDLELFLESENFEALENAGRIELSIMLSKNFSNDKCEYNVQLLMGNGWV